MLSYSALLQAGGGVGNSSSNSGSGGNNGNKKDGHSSPQPLLLQAASPAAAKGTSPLSKTGGATISIITGKVCVCVKDLLMSESKD